MWALLTEWNACVQKANSLCHSINLKSHKLLEPWDVKGIPPGVLPVSHDQHQRVVCKFSEHGMVGREEVNALSKEEEDILNEAERLLNHAHNTRKKALNKNADVLSIQSTTAEVEKGDSPQSKLNEVNEGLQQDPLRDKKEGEDFISIASSALEQLMQKHCILEQNVTEQKLKIASAKNIQRLSSGASKGTSLRTMGSKSDPKLLKNRKAAVKVSRPVSAAKASQYKTSSSEIGKMVKVSRNSNQKTVISKRLGDKGGSGNTFTVDGMLRNRSTGCGQKGRPSQARGDKDQTSGPDPQVSTKSDKKLQKFMQSYNKEAIDHNIINKQSTMRTDVGIKQNSQQERSSDVRDDRDGLRQDASMVKDNLQQETPFTLQRDGKCLRVPNEIRKLWSSNSKVRSKVTEIECRRDQVRGQTSKKHFIAQIHAMADDLSCEYLHVQHTLNRVGMLTTEREKLVTIGRSGPTERKGNRSVFMNDAADDRLPEMRKELEILLSEDLGAIADWHSSFAHPVAPPTAIEYSTLKDLQTWIGLKLQVLYLQQQIGFEQAIADILLPAFLAMDPADPSFNSLYRSLSGLIGSGGEAFPALIQFEEAEEDNSEEQEKMSSAVT